MTIESRKVCLVCSSGGHFYELYHLNTAWQELEHFWVTFSSPDTRHVLKQEKVYSAYSPTNRSIKNFFRNFFLARKVLAKEKPDIIISTGAGVCVPFFYLGRLRGAKTIYIESLARINELSLTGRLIYPVATEFIVQWPELADKRRKTRFKGQLL